MSNVITEKCSQRSVRKSLLAQPSKKQSKKARKCFACTKVPSSIRSFKDNVQIQKKVSDGIDDTETQKRENIKAILRISKRKLQESQQKYYCFYF